MFKNLRKKKKKRLLELVTKPRKPYVQKRDTFQMRRTGPLWEDENWETEANAEDAWEEGEIVESNSKNLENLENTQKIGDHLFPNISSVELKLLPDDEGLSFYFILFYFHFQFIF